MARLRVGAIGCGYWGPNLIRNMVETSTAKMCAVADLDEGRLQKIRTRYPRIETVSTNYRDLFDCDLDAVIVSTPPRTHYDIARDCLEHGLHVLIEKPMTVDVESSERLIDLAQRKGRVLMVGHTFEFNPAVHALKNLIDAGELGEIHYIDVVRANLGLFQKDLNVIWDLAPHDISILIHILGQAPTSVSVRGAACVHKEVEDVAYMAMTFPEKILAHSRMSWLDPCKTRKITVVGSEKMVVYDDVENLEKIRVYNKRVKATRRTETYGEFQYAYHYGDVISPYIRFEEPLRLECEHFLDCIREGKTPLTDGLNGLRVVSTIEAAQTSLAEGGRTVELSSATAPRRVAAAAGRRARPRRPLEAPAPGNTPG